MAKFTYIQDLVPYLAGMKIDLFDGDEVAFAAAAGQYFAEGNDLETAAALREIVLGAAPIVGTSNAETLVGTTSNEVLYAAQGNDALYGREGNDLLQGGLGNDTLSGDAGNDIYAFNRGDGQDIIDEWQSTWGGNDTIEFGPGIASADLIVSQASSGKDLVLAINGTTDQITIVNTVSDSNHRVEQVRLYDGTVLTYADLMARATAPTAGNDVFYGDEQANTLNGGGGSDTLRGRDGNDLLQGGVGNDTLSGDAGNDTYAFSLGDGQDTIQEVYNSWGGSDTLQLGPGITSANLVVSQASSGKDLVLAVNGTTDQIKIVNTVSDSNHRVEQARFDDGTVLTYADLMARATTPTAGNDVFYGDEQANTLNGGGGSDTLRGRDGYDLLQGGVGNDTLSGDAGNDTYAFSLGDGQDTIQELYNSWGGSDTLQFGPGVSSANLAVSQASSGNDLILAISGTADQIKIVKTVSDSNYRVEQVRFDDGAVLTHADLMARATTPTSGNDVFYGDEQANVLNGGAGNDTLNARGGNDLLEGGTGNDFFIGGVGNDTFVFRTGFGQDTVTDFSAGTSVADVIRFEDGIFADFAAVQAAATTTGSDTLITVDEMTSITLKSVALAGLNQNDFSFV